MTDELDEIVSIHWVIIHEDNTTFHLPFDRFKCSWLATAVDIWKGLPADLILQGEASEWRTILKDVQCCVCI